MDEKTPTKAGFQIGSQFYPFPEGFRLGDPVLIEEVTGMDFNAFAEAIDDETRRESPVILLGLVAVAVWQTNPRWKRDRVAQFVQTLDIESVESIGTDEGPDDAVPMSGAAASAD